MRRQATELPAVRPPLPEDPVSPWRPAPGGARAYPALERDLRVDVAIVGAGICGLTAATRLKRTGRTVAVLEAASVGAGASADTTAHLTEAVDARYWRIARNFGLEAARIVAAGSREAIEEIATTVREHGIACGFERVPGWLWSESDAHAKEIHDEHQAASDAGLEVAMYRETPLPFPVRDAIRFEDQALFHPYRYLAALAATVPMQGSHLFEDTRVRHVEDGKPCRVLTATGRTVEADTVIVAASVPLNVFFLQTKIAHYRSYALAFPMRAPAAPLAPGLYWDMEDPYHYVRTATLDGGEWLIAGGEDHKTAHERDTWEAYGRLADWARARFGAGEPGFRWSGQIIEPVDGLPYVGRNSFDSRVLVATGFAGNGMTFGTLAGIILSDQVAGLAHPGATIFDATRIKPIAGAGAFLRENLAFPVGLTVDRLRPAECRDSGDVHPGEGRILASAGGKVAAYRTPEGELRTVSAVCTHLGCIVRFNSAERTWDCPCHGSRFDTHGIPLDGPATRPLEPREVAGDGFAGGA